MPSGSQYPLLLHTYSRNVSMKVDQANQNNSANTADVPNVLRVKVGDHFSTKQPVYDLGSASGGHDCANYASIYPGNATDTTANRQGPNQLPKNERSKGDPFFFEGRVSDARLAELSLTRVPTSRSLLGTEELPTRRG
ncbi:hypothetical protein AC579_6338 [Pseudocercospora musae]|uniref:Uncharacterized protein n=1 Tax=Pseudocercospora musae TaxID=113226 RepID=A0A139I7D6_9PEZI|nr:hypothetical protein AC579_6338 [Pseudocercospora musae]